jgi:hypothetical protein
VAWSDIRITVAETELVATSGSVTRRFRFDEIGFADRRKSGNPPDLVWHLLRLLAERRGIIPATSRDGIDVPDGLKQRVHKLNERMDAVFQLGKPAVSFHRRTKEYRTACGITSATPPRHPLPHAAGWDDIGITELADGHIEVAVDGTEERDGASDGVAWTRRYTLRELGLVDDHDTPTVVGEALLRLLRGHGRFDAETPERAKLELNQWLTGFFDRPEPFAVRRGDEWVAKFAADSHARPGQK